MGISEGQICVEVQEVDEVVTGVAIVDQLVVNDDQVIKDLLLSLRLLIREQDVV